MLCFTLNFTLWEWKVRGFLVLSRKKGSDMMGGAFSPPGVSVNCFVHCFWEGSLRISRHRYLHCFLLHLSSWSTQLVRTSSLPIHIRFWSFWRLSCSYPLVPSSQNSTTENHIFSLKFSTCQTADQNVISLECTELKNARLSYLLSLKEKLFSCPSDSTYIISADMITVSVCLRISSFLQFTFSNIQTLNLSSSSSQSVLVWRRVFKKQPEL